MTPGGLPPRWVRIAIRTLKASMFNIADQFEGGILLANSFSRACLLLTEEQWEIVSRVLAADSTINNYRAIAEFLQIEN
jgi:hypothetical protein